MRESPGLSLARELASVADAKKGEEVVILDLAGRHSLIDYFVVATAASAKQAKVMGEEAFHHVKRKGISFRHLEASSDWVCGDFGDVVLHVFTPDARTFYDIENLWGDASRVEWTPVEVDVPA